MWICWAFRLSHASFWIGWKHPQSHLEGACYVYFNSSLSKCYVMVYGVRSEVCLSVLASMKNNAVLLSCKAKDLGFQIAVLLLGVISIWNMFLKVCRKQTLLYHMNKNCKSFGPKMWWFLDHQLLTNLKNPFQRPTKAPCKPLYKPDWEPMIWKICRAFIFPWNVK